MPTKSKPETHESATPKSHLSKIVTDAKAMKEGTRETWEEQLKRYQKAIKKFVVILLPGPDADVVANEICLKLLDGHYQEKWDPNKGRFRNYLKAAIRNAARRLLRDHAARREVSLVLESLADNRHPEVWVSLDGELREKILERARKDLARHQQRHPEDRWATIIAALEQFGQTDTKLSDMDYLRTHVAGPAVSDATLRKQVERARKRYARLIWDAAAQFVAQPTSERVEQELRALDLWQWASKGMAKDTEND